MPGRRAIQSALGGAHTPRPALGPSDPVGYHVRGPRPPLLVERSCTRAADATVGHRPDKVSSLTRQSSAISAGQSACDVDFVAPLNGASMYRLTGQGTLNRSVRRDPRPVGDRALAVLFTTLVREGGSSVVQVGEPGCPRVGRRRRRRDR
jgi:hypothetical protein